MPNGCVDRDTGTVLRPQHVRWENIVVIHHGLRVGLPGINRLGTFVSQDLSSFRTEFMRTNAFPATSCLPLNLRKSSLDTKSLSLLNTYLKTPEPPAADSFSQRILPSSSHTETFPYREQDTELHLPAAHKWSPALQEYLGCVITLKPVSNSVNEDDTVHVNSVLPNLPQ